MFSELFVGLVVKAFDRCFLNRAVHAFDPAVGPWVPHFRQPMLDSVSLVPHIEHVRHVGGGWTIPIARRKGELDAVIRQNRMNSVRNGCNQGLEEHGGRPSVRLVHQLREGEFRSSVNCNVEMELSFGCLHFRQIDMEISVVSH